MDTENFLYGCAPSRTVYPWNSPEPNKATYPFLVWRDGGTAPTVRHTTRAVAETEARRLANANPGKTFYVMGALSISSAPPAPKANTRSLV